MIRKLTLLLIILCFLSACTSVQEPVYDLESLLNAYGEVWNSGDLAPLDTLVTDDCSIRFNSSGPFTGKQHLISGIEATRDPFSDFSLEITDLTAVSDTVCLIDWEIKARRKTDGEAFTCTGFSTIFHSGGRITGEWISYSEIDWVTGLGYSVKPPE